MALAEKHPTTVEIRQTLLLAGPVIGSQLAQVSMGFVDTVMVGRLGAEALAGVALGHTILFFVLLICMGMAFAVGPMVSQAFGAGDEAAIGRSVRQGLWLGVLLSMPAIAVIALTPSFLLAIGQSPEIVTLTRSYLYAAMWGIPGFIFFSALRSFVEGLSRPRPILVITLVGVAFNISGNYVLMFGKLGFPALGLVGTGIATSIVMWVMCLLLALYVHRSRYFTRHRVFRPVRRPDPAVLGELVRIGWPIGVTFGIESALFTVTALMIGYLGAVPLAAHQVALQCAAFTFMVPLGIGIAGSVRVGQAAGRGDFHAVRRSGFVAISLSAVFMIMAAVAFWTIPSTIISLYLDLDDPSNASVVQMATRLLAIAAVFQVFDGVQVSAGGALRGLKDTRVPMFIGAISYWGVGLTSGYFFGFVLGGGAQGLWWGLVGGLATAAVLLTLRFARSAGRRGRRDVPPHEIGPISA
jgi:multidrug resistance protein, MATE family